MRNIYEITEPKDLTHGRGYVYSMQYHIVWCTKCRKPVFVNGLEAETADFIVKTAETLDMDIMAMEVKPDHVHLLVDAKPQLRPSDAIKIIKGNVARWLFLEHPELKQDLRDGRLWNRSYFIASVSKQSREQVEAYINEQKG